MRVRFRVACREDLPVIVALIADDGLGRTREHLSDALAPEYIAAFEQMDGDPNQIMAVAEMDQGVIGYLQITFIPGLSRKGALRGQLESVRVASHMRGRGIGEEFFHWAIAQCQARGCTLVQLTTDRQRESALRFYKRLGFVHSHNGMKLQL